MPLAAIPNFSAQFNRGNIMPKTKTHYDSDQLNDLLLQMLETELGDEQVYCAALTCAVNSDLKKE